MSRPAVEAAATRKGERDVGGRQWLGGLIVLGAAILVACGSGDDDDGAAEAATLPPTAAATATPEPARTPPARDLLSEAEAQSGRGTAGTSSGGPSTVRSRAHSGRP